MITYEVKYDGEKKPEILKVFTASSGERMEAVISFNSSDEVDLVPTDTIFSYLQSCVDHIKVLVESISVLEREDPEITPWHIKNWEKIEEIKEISSSWWQIGYYRDEPESDPNA